MKETIELNKSDFDQIIVKNNIPKNIVLVKGNTYIFYYNKKLYGEYSLGFNQALVHNGYNPVYFWKGEGSIEVNKAFNIIKSSNFKKNILSIKLEIKNNYLIIILHSNEMNDLFHSNSIAIDDHLKDILIEFTRISSINNLTKMGKYLYNLLFFEVEDSLLLKINHIDILNKTNIPFGALHNGKYFLGEIFDISNISQKSLFCYIFIQRIIEPA